MGIRSAERSLELIETSPAVAEALVCVDEMSDADLRTLVAGEPPTMAEAAEAIIARRQAAARASR